MKSAYLVLLLTALLGAMPYHTAQAAPVDEATLSERRLISAYDFPGLRKKISLDLLQPMDVVDLIKFITQKAELNVVIGKGVSGATKLMLKNVSIADALEIVLAANDLAYTVKGDILTIMGAQEYRTLYGQSFYDQRRVKILSLQYATPSRIAAVLAELKSEIGKIVYDDKTGTLVLIDIPEKLREMAEYARLTELPTMARRFPTETRVFSLRYMDVEEIATKLRGSLTPGVGELNSDKRTRSLVITDLPHVVKRFADIIAVFDRRPRQVFLEAKIVQVTLTESFSLGINWEHVFHGLDPRFALQSVSSFPANLSGDSFGRLRYQTVLGGGDLDLVINALSVIGDTKILSNPHIAVLDGEQAHIMVVEEQPYAEVTYETGTTNVTGVNYTFIPVGVSLTVTPQISDDGFINVQIKPEVSAITEWYDSTRPQEGVPVVKTSNAETTVRVKDGVTIVIAGMIQEENADRKGGIPFLSRIPLLGIPFRSRGTTKVNKETVVFLTPRIIEGDEPFLQMNGAKKFRPLRSVGKAGHTEEDED